MLEFSHQFTIVQENETKPIVWGKSGKLVIRLFPQHGYFFSHLILILWEMHGFSHQFPIVLENATKPIVWRRPGKLVLIVKYGYYFPIRFSSYGIVHRMGNTWVFPSISHSAGKCDKTHCMGKTWKISNETFPIAWVLFLHLIPILWYTSLYGKYMGFIINFPQYWKVQQNPSYGDDLGNWYSYFSHSMSAFFPFDSHSVVSFVTWEVHGFPINFPLHKKIQQNPSYGENLGNWYSYFSHSMGAFYPVIFSSYGTLHYMGNVWVF